MKSAAGLERRKEDYGLITGQANFVDDVRLAEGRPSVLHMLVVRSPYAHATIDSIQLAAARAIPGVVAVLTGEELLNDMSPLNVMPVPPGIKRPERRPMAVKRVRYVGDTVAVVLAEQSYAAEDARDAVEVDYTPLPVAIDLEAAIKPDAPRLYDEFDSNIAYVSPARHGDIHAAFAQADQTLHLRIVNQRLAPSSMEPRACLFDYDPATSRLDAWLSSQAVFRARDTLASFLGIEREHIAVHNAQVGGGFGAKTTFVGEELIAALLAVKYGRPVKWIETRSENLQAQTHGRGQINFIEAAFRNDGRLLGIKLRTLGDLGAFVFGISGMIPNRTPSLLSGPYRVEAVESEVVGVFTNKVPTTAYRGAGRPEAAYILERIMDAIAHQLELDPAEVRRRNFIAPDAFPCTVVTGLRYDSGNYPALLDKALELSDYSGWRAKQREHNQKESNSLLGIGLATFIETSGDGSHQQQTPREAATVRIRRDGTLLVQSGVSHTGQGHFTAFAQIAAEVFSLPGSQVEVRMNDSSLPGFSIGTFASRVTQMGGSAVFLAAEAARKKVLQVAAHILEATPDDLELVEGKVRVRGVPSRTVTLGELAQLVEEQPELIERDQPNPANGTPIEGLAAWHDFQSPGESISSGAHVAIVKIDRDTGEVEILSYVAVDDCGRVLNHYLTEAQIHGSLAQGIGQALYEEAAYGQDGQFLTGTLLDYSLPNARAIPDITTAFVETPSPYNPLGAKGVGESGCIGGPPAIVNAVLDALTPLGITTLDMPLTPEKIWVSLQSVFNYGSSQ